MLALEVPPPGGRARPSHRLCPAPAPPQVLACLMRHFRASLASLPLLAQPVSALPIGTWAPTSGLAAQIAAEGGGGADDEQQQQQVCAASGGPGGTRQAASPLQHYARACVATSGRRKRTADPGRSPHVAQGGERKRARRARRVARLACVSPDTPLTQALGLLLEAGVSSLPVVDASGGRALGVVAGAWHTSVPLHSSSGCAADGARSCGACLPLTQPPALHPWSPYLQERWSTSTRAPTSPLWQRWAAGLLAGWQGSVSRAARLCGSKAKALHAGQGGRRPG